MKTFIVVLQMSDEVTLTEIVRADEADIDGNGNLILYVYPDEGRGETDLMSWIIVSAYRSGHWKSIRESKYKDIRVKDLNMSRTYRSRLVNAGIDTIGKLESLVESGNIRNVAGLKISKDGASFLRGLVNVLREAISD